ncbi:MAG: flavin reductase family protein [Nitrososphaeria archaeon]|nr:flavin reductase family protein [Nitrososphaeria archaeon]
MKKDVEALNLPYLLHPKLTLLVTCGPFEESNIIPIAWSVPISRTPPLVGIAVSPKRYSYSLIEKYRVFAINVPTYDQLNAIKVCGSVSGRDKNKWEMAKLTKEKAKKIDTAIIRECIGHIECVLDRKLELGDHSLFVGKVVAAYVEEEAYASGILNTLKFKPPLHLGKEVFTTTL